jgi:hypothetical protein
LNPNDVIPFLRRSRHALFVLSGAKYAIRTRSARVVAAHLLWHPVAISGSKHRTGVFASGRRAWPAATFGQASERPERRRRNRWTQPRLAGAQTAANQRKMTIVSEVSGARIVTDLVVLVVFLDVAGVEWFGTFS